MERELQDHVAHITNLPAHLKSELGTKKDKVRITFRSPTPEGLYLPGPNHRFVGAAFAPVCSPQFEKRDPMHGPVHGRGGHRCGEHAYHALYSSGCAMRSAKCRASRSSIR